MRSAAAPDRKPTRRISRGVNVLAPPCPVRGPEAGRTLKKNMTVRLEEIAIKDPS